jgi:hypothetical protein
MNTSVRERECLFSYGYSIESASNCCYVKTSSSEILRSITYGGGGDDKGQQQHIGGVGHKTCSLKTEGGLGFSVWIF